MGELEHHYLHLFNQLKYLYPHPYPEWAELRQKVCKACTGGGCGLINLKVYLLFIIYSYPVTMESGEFFCPQNISGALQQQCCSFLLSS